MALWAAVLRSLLFACGCYVVVARASDCTIGVEASDTILLQTAIEVNESSDVDDDPSVFSNPPPNQMKAGEPSSFAEVGEMIVLRPPDLQDKTAKQLLQELRHEDNDEKPDRQVLRTCCRMLLAVCVLLAICNYSRSIESDSPVAVHEQCSPAWSHPLHESSPQMVTGPPSSADGSGGSEGISSTPPAGAATHHYRADIDGLRGLAVISVVVYHMDNSWLPGGFSGVDVFFVISGYVVSGSVFRGSNSSVLDCFLGFYARRIKRIAPASITVIVVVTLLCALLVPPDYPSLKEHFMTGQYGLLCWANNYLASRNTNYFTTHADDVMNPFLHLWSLGIEEQFYFVFPAVTLLAYGSGHRAFNRADGKDTGCSLRSVTVWIGCIAASLLTASTFMHGSQQKEFYTLPSRFWELATGALVFDTEPLWSRVVLAGGKPLTFLLQFVAVFFLGLGLTVTSEDNFPFPEAWISVLGALLYIVAGASGQSSFNQMMGRRWPVLVGKLSYSIYLWHWPVLCLMHWFAPVSACASIIIPILIFTAASALTYNYIECPLRSWKPRPQNVVFIWLLASVLAASACIQMVALPGYGQFYIAGAEVAKVNLPPGTIMNLDGSPHCQCSVSEEGSESSEVDHLRTCFKNDSQLQAIWDCFDTDFSDQASIDRCLSPRQHEKPVLYLFGDSHAQHLILGLREASKHLYELRTYAAPQQEINYLELEMFLLKTLRPGDVVVWSNAAWMDGRMNRPDGSVAAKVKMKNVRLQQLTIAKGAYLILMGDIICHTGDQNRCLPTKINPHPDEKCKILRKVGELSILPQRIHFQHLAAQSNNTRFYDINDHFCDESTCGAVIPSTHIIQQTGGCHLTASASSYLWPYFCNVLSSLRSDKSLESPSH